MKTCDAEQQVCVWHMEAWDSYFHQECSPSPASTAHPYNGSPGPHLPTEANAVVNLAQPVQTEKYFAFLATGFAVSFLHFHDINNSQFFVSNAEPIYIYEKECVRKYEQIIPRKSQDGFRSHYYHPVRSGGN